MTYLGFLGFWNIGDVMRLSVQCFDANLTAVAPTSAPTWSIYDEADDSAVQTGSLGSSDADSKTGYRTGNVTLSTANGFAADTHYRVRFQFAESGNTRAVEARFQIT